MERAAILGATGATGIHLAAALSADATPLRVVARGKARLDRLFPDAAIEKVEADMLDEGDALRAIDGCGLVYDCIGLPGDQMHLHPPTARNIAGALQRTGARGVQVSSYWAYMPQVRATIDDSHPRVGGPPWARYRREAEDILCAAGAAILHLPDFYGPHVSFSALQNPLREAAAGKTMNWIGPRDVPREHIYVPDAMRIAAAIGRRPQASGAHWCLPGAGPLTGAEAAAIADRHLKRRVKLRPAGLWLLRLVSLFNKELRGFMQVAPEYMKPVRYDGHKLESLLGRQTLTSYESGIARTLDWLAAPTGERGAR
jgi:nucleoside-diphosphate-sugar epimerase